MLIVGGEKEVEAQLTNGSFVFLLSSSYFSAAPTNPIMML